MLPFFPSLSRWWAHVRHDLARWIVGAVLLLATATWAQPARLRPAAPGLNEAGVPNFAINSPASLGLSAPPTDLQPLPDGRILALAGREVAIGDGTRWEVFRLAPDETAITSAQIAVDAAGQIYSGMPEWFARMEFNPDGNIHRSPVARTPDRVMAPATVFAVDGRWYWHGGVGEVVRWSPGETPVTVGRITDLERALALGGADYLSDRADGSFWRITPSGLQRVDSPAETNVSRSITCGLDLGDGRLVVGTNGHGLQRFVDGRLVPLTEGGPLVGLSRINDLCPTVEGLYAAAVDNLGIVFFDRALRTVQVLDRSLDHRLARVRRLFYTRLGTVWGLLNDGIVRVEFPSRVSHYEPMVSTGLVFAQPYRFAGRLWLLGDGQAQRAVYNDDGRLLRFDIDTPEGEFLCSLSTETGALLAGGRNGVYRREGDAWRLVVPGLINVHLADAPDGFGRWAFFAQDAVGWLRPEGEGYELRVFPSPGLGGPYGAIRDSMGALWAELGTARTARLELAADAPRVQTFGPAHGLEGGWVQLSILDGEIRADVAGRLLRFDAAAGRFVPDTAFTQAVPEAGDVLGRPAQDARGRLWLATSRTTFLYERHGPGYRRLDEVFPAGLLPLFFTIDDSGPVWLHQRLQLARYDPALPLPARAEPRVLVTRVQLTSSNRTLFAPGETLPALDFDDNSLVAHFVVVDAAPSRTITFDVRLEGASQGDWVSTGVVGSAVFNRLKEGSYTLHLRPVAGGIPGRTTALRFTVRPPWFRTTAAWVGYGLGGIGFIALVAWYASWRARRDKARLEHLVARRTHELNEANQQLAGNMDATLRQSQALRASEERYRQLSSDLERRVAERTDALVRANDQLIATNQELESFSYSISHDLRAPLRNINGFVDLLRRRNRASLDSESNRFFQIIATETIRLSQLIDSLLSFARLSRADVNCAPVALGPLVAQVIAELRPEFEQRLVDWRISPLPTVTADAALLRQVVVNLVANAIKFTRQRSPAVIEIGTQPPDAAHPGEHVVYVRDNGAGFDPQYSGKLFGVFQRLHNVREFEGTGIGLANAKRIIVRHGGRIWAESVQGEGATFYFTLPPRAPADGL